MSGNVCSLDIALDRLEGQYDRSMPSPRRAVEDGSLEHVGARFSVKLSEEYNIIGARDRDGHRFEVAAALGLEVVNVVSRAGDRRYGGLGSDGCR